MVGNQGWMAVLVAAAVMAGAAGHWPSGRSSVARPASHGTPVRLVADPLRFVTADSGNSARYRVREQLVGHDLPNDAVGTTGGVTGMIVIGADGKLVAGESRFVVDLMPLKSDQSRRDRYVQGRILETEKFPTVTLAATGVTGLRAPLPTSGAVTFQLMGDLTVHGVTKPTSWQVTANVEGADLTGRAATWFTFADFGLLQPHVPVLLSVVDTIKLEYDFHLVRK
jgi:polyisoprenoid-binding protein YceI